MVDQDELRATRVQRVRAYEYISWMRVAVDPAPTEDLRAEKVDHRLHDPFCASFERPEISQVGRREHARPPEGRHGFRRQVRAARIWCHEPKKTLPVREAHAVDPLRGEHPLRRIFRVNFRYVHAVC